MTASPTKLVIDASVLMASADPEEVNHSDAIDFVKRVHATRSVLHEPPQFLLEVYAAFKRRPREIKQLRFMTEEDPIVIKFAPMGHKQVEDVIAWLTLHCPDKCPTRGADLAYLAVAIDFNLPLITLDGGLESFKEYGLPIYTPADFLPRMG